MRQTIGPGASGAVTAGNGPGIPAGGKPPSWKLALALVSLALSLLLWLNGLVDSLSRPSVGGDLNLRQLELALLGTPAATVPATAARRRKSS